MQPSERDFWIALSIWTTVFGTGLWVLVVEGHWALGSSVTFVGLAGLVFLSRHFKERRVKLHYSLGLALLLTWALLGYDIYLKYNPPTSGHVLHDWGTDADKACAATIDGDLLMQYRDKYRVALVCGLADSTIDKEDDPRITVTHLFTITKDLLAISAPDSRELSEALQASVLAIMKGAPKNGAGPTIQWTRWYLPILLPVHSDISNVHRLSDVARNGGMELHPGAAVAVIINNAHWEGQ